MMTTSADSKKVALKLHKQFAHPTPEKLIRLLKCAKMNNSDLEEQVKSVSETCNICCKLRKPTPRPIVSIPLAYKFNETISVDLKVWKVNLYFLVIVDIATRYCSAIVIRDKNPKTIIKGLFLTWISHFGAPRKLLSDNGGEFNNVDMRQLGESFNMKIMTTAAQSPWSNGICERQNAVIGDLVNKILLDTSCDIETALAWAISARNALSNFSGFSPNQLVFGFNPALPNVFHDQPPALEEVSSSNMVRENLNALHIARKGFIEQESSEKIRRALRSNVRNTSVDELNSGDEVYYKRNDSKE